MFVRTCQISLILPIALAACSPPTISATETLFVPPTAISSPTPVPTAVPELATDLPEPVCSDDLTFVSDITIPDGSVVLAGDSLDKRWQVTNAGTCNWDPTYSIRLISGSELGVETQLPLIPAIAGENTEIRVEFTAPAEPGYYLTEWQAHDSEGNPFGVSIFMEIIVQE
jgi:hypothetical protein